MDKVKVWATANLNLRSSPSIDARNPKSNIVVQVPEGAELELVEGIPPIKEGQYEFTAVLYRNPLATKNTLANRIGWAATLFLRESAPPPPPPPPPPPTSKRIFGLHYYYLTTPYYPEYDYFWRMVKEKLVSTVVVVNELGVANQLAEMGVPNVVLRLGVTGDDPDPNTNLPIPKTPPNLLPPFTGTLNDFKLGQEWFQANWAIGADKADPRVILQIGNEWQIREDIPECDNHFWRGAIAEADRANRILAVFNDSVGTPDIDPVQGGYKSKVWEARRGAIMATLVDGANQTRRPDRRHVISYHAYSKEGPYKATDPDAWNWWAGRLHLVFGSPDSLYPTLRPRILYTEYGSFDASVPKMPGGIKDVIDDIRVSLEKPDPLTDGFAYWTLGDWKESNIRAGMPQIYDLVKSHYSK